MTVEKEFLKILVMESENNFIREIREQKIRFENIVFSPYSTYMENLVLYSHKDS